MATDIRSDTHGREGRDRLEGQESVDGQKRNDAPREDVDETLEETFPASDAPANTPETGIRIDPTPDAAAPDVTIEEKKNERR